MVCFAPIKGYRGKRVNPETGKRPVVFSPSQGFLDRPVIVPCGRCLGCLMTRAFYWSVRCVCESHYHSESYFLTLTYDKEHLPSDGQLCRAHFQSFMKRLRYYFPGYRIKVFYCGEYGEKRHRPHYHAILFGLPLNAEGVKMYPVSTSKRGNINYESPFITSIWSYGLVTIGSFSANSAAYVAQYTVKKHDNAMQSYIARCSVKPFIGASNRNSIGYDFFMQYHTDIYRRGFFKPFDDSDIICRNLPYFNRLLQRHFPIEFFKYVELPRRAYYASLYKSAQSGSPGTFGNTLLDRDSIALYYKERKLLRNLKSRDDF